MLRVRTLLRFAYAHVQMMLYRPFLHYISPRLSVGRTVDDRYYACAAAGISVSRNIMHIAMEIKNQALVVGPFWTMLYTQFFAILTLVFYVLENPDKPGSAEIFADAAGAREMIAKMGPRSFAADRITKSLNTLWENLPVSIKNGKANTLPSKKRSAPEPKTGSVSLSSHKTPGSSTKIASSASRKSLVQRPSFEKTHKTYSQRALSMTYSDLHPMDASSTGAAPDISSVTPSTTHPSNPYMRASQTIESPSIYKLDAMMFPSGDPFDYPKQPLLDYGATVATHVESSNPSHISAVQGHHANSRNFYMPGVYGDIEGQLSKTYIQIVAEERTLATNKCLTVGPIPPYLMQSSPPGQNGLDLSGQMYQSPSPLTVQQAQAHHAGHGHHAHHRQPHQRVGLEMDEMMADSGFNRTWDMFGGNFKPL